MFYFLIIYSQKKRDKRIDQKVIGKQQKNRIDRPNNQNIKTGKKTNAYTQDNKKACLIKLAFIRHHQNQNLRTRTM